MTAVFMQRAWSGVIAIAAEAYHTVTLASPTVPGINTQAGSQTVKVWQSVDF